MNKILFKKYLYNTLIISANLLLLSSPVFSHKYQMISGINIGIEGGRITHKGIFEGANKSQSMNVKGNAPNLGFFLGYTHRIDPCYFLGIEATAKYQNAEYVSSLFKQRSPIRNNFSMKNSFGANFLFGINKSSKNFFVKIGYVHTNFKLKLDLNNSFSIHEKQKKGGFLTGIGFEYSLTPTWSIGAIYDQIWYEKIKFNKKFEGAYNPMVHNISYRIKYSF